MIMSESLDAIDVIPLTFPPEVLSRISPELSLQRHLSLSLRPSLKGLQEFREVNIENNLISRYSNDNIPINDKDNTVIGSNILKCGRTIVMTSITAGIIESDVQDSLIDYGERELIEMCGERDTISKYSTVYPVVEVERGRGGAPPSDEEMNVSQKLHDCLLQSGILSKDNLKIKCGIRTIDSEGTVSIKYPEDNDNDILEELNSKRHWSFILYAKIDVFSRTGPIFDMCWNSLIYALKNTRLPKVFIDDRAMRLKKMVRSRGRSAAVKETYNMLCHETENEPLQLNDEMISYASNYGVVAVEDEEEGDEKTKVLITDIDEESEESSVQSTMCIISGEGRLKSVEIIGGGSTVGIEEIKNAIAISQIRSKDLKEVWDKK
ncbi:hypothetical protein Kpol_2002p50 [Vanderwaltozyma polyspora DSM 70294]|uniref:Ribosomal RNA-processing protein 43 n=1 Tax=Vanderwaltozyma polyspora (strain ATCC 22028 / DSM 70294 / BCRC 21397 / CBS 2163 / NBRC 10782 / NRRL Y-8283 / UCD 57-17) TaxID=436907 RepID=A7TFG5_VANPO|nr:uncharacterized protein Kpol_2002p50 [Vanderwaltozyma polyspora DSM 70294]EDO18979.1 hypothetical protein Kpol_2002p50 [Vanderwaltozyma polyspora DSM 70294]